MFFFFCFTFCTTIFSLKSDISNNKFKIFKFSSQLKKRNHIYSQIELKFIVEMQNRIMSYTYKWNETKNKL